MANVYEVTFDSGSDNWAKSRAYNIMFLVHSVHYLNLLLEHRCRVDEQGNTIMRGYVTLNELLDNIGLPLIPDGLEKGWIFDTNDQDKYDVIDIKLNPRGTNPNVKVKFGNIVNLVGELVP